MLFREEARRARTERLYGRINLAIPIAWQAIGFLLLGTIVAAAIFLGLATYSRVETAQGQISLDNGVAAIVPSRSGIVTALFVTDGQAVKKGAVLAHIRAAEDMIEGSTAPSLMRQALQQQSMQLQSQAVLLSDAAKAEIQKYREEIVGLRLEIQNIKSQISEQMRLIDSAVDDYENAKRVAVAGFVSRRDLSDRQATVISRRQQLYQLRQTLAQKFSAIREAERTMAQVESSSRAQIASTRNNQAALRTQIAEASLNAGYVIRAPIDGRITAITNAVGQQVTPSQSMMILMPNNSTIRAELSVPTNAIGFIKKGQHVRLAIDAFPYQTYGTVNSTIESISLTSLVKPSSPSSAPTYIVKASIDNPYIMLSGSKQPLIPGMTLSARIITERRSLLRWLLQPILAVQRR